MGTENLSKSNQKSLKLTAKFEFYPEVAFWTFMSAIGGKLSIFGLLQVPQGYSKIIRSPRSENQGKISTYLALLGSDGL